MEVSFKLLLNRWEASLAMVRLNFRNWVAENVTIETLPQVYMQEMKTVHRQTFLTMDTSKNGKVNSSELEFYCQKIFEDVSNDFKAMKNSTEFNWPSVNGIDFTPKNMT